MIYIIGDIHGCFYTLEKLLKKVRTKDEDPHFVFIGDYIDRGLHSKEVVDLLIELQKEGAECLRGNHDDVVDWICNRECSSDLSEFVRGTPDIDSVSAWWLWNGFGTTVSSYAPEHSSLAPYRLVMDLFLSRVPDSHKAFFRGLKLYWENETHFACHGYLDPSKELPRSLAFLPESAAIEMLWSRFPQKRDHSKSPYGPSIGVDCEAVWDKIGVFGHSPVKGYGAVAPIKHGKIRLIDTAAFDNGYLCAYCCEQDDWLLQATDSRDV